MASTALLPSSEHGTGVVSVLVDTYAKGSPQALDILVGEILEQRFGGTAGSLLSAIKALDWLVGEGTTIINMSFQVRENAVFAKILDRIAASGVVLVAAAGNQGANPELSFPAAHPKVLAVTAIDSRGNAPLNTRRDGPIDFAAPGLDVVVATPTGTGHRSGTSYAAPYVTSIVALELQRGVTRDTDLIKKALASNAYDLGKPGRDEVYGWGLPRIIKRCGAMLIGRS